MPRCPMCKEELTTKTKSGWKCDSCGEDIPENYEDYTRPSCGCGHSH